MKPEVWVPVLISALALGPSIYAFIKIVRADTVNKSDVVFQNALALIEANKKQAEINEQQANTLRNQLEAANKTIEDISAKLFAANKRADTLSDHLAEANIEIISLRNQIESMSKQVDGEGNGRS